MRELTIDPFFRDKIPPLTPEEFEQLRENILSDGEVYEPLIIWGDTIIDGHNRWKIICENWERLKDKFHTKQMDFPDKWAAAEWMYKKQLGRRNLTDGQKTYAIGKMYEARKNSVGGTGANQYTKGQSAQSEHTAKAWNRTAEIIAEETGVGKETVKRAEKFAHGVDKIREVDPETADKILTGGVQLAKSEVQALSAANPEQVKEAVDDIKSGKKSKYFVPTDRKKLEKTDLKPQIPRDPNWVPEYGLDEFLEEIKGICDNCMKQLARAVNDNREIVEGNAAEVTNVFNAIINKLENLKGAF